jgi:hypothetical protein
MKHKLMPAISWLFPISYMIASAGQPAAAQLAPTAAVELAPHRAVYELTLDRASAGSNVTDIRGRLVYEFTGSTCQGYTLNTRLVTEIFDREGKPNTTDIRSESFEEADGGKFRFTTAQYVNNKLSESTKGTASRRRRNREAVIVELEKPKKEALTLSGNVFFPTQHSLAVLKAASSGQNRLQADIYDGSEKGVKVYETTTAIGGPLAGGENAKLPAIKNADALNGVVSWPVVVSYYDPTQKKDGLPTYEISFRMYANGVSRKLRLDYGTFSLSGELTSIEFLEAKACP